MIGKAPVCHDCKHLHRIVGQFTCDAFPEGIPFEIARDGNLHKTPLPGQQNDIIFEPVTDN